MAVDLQSELARVAALVNGRLASFMSGQPAELYQAASHLIHTGGKRLRPFIALKTCQLLGGREESALPVAVAVECIHNFTLVHDDIMDSDALRHNVPTVHVRFGLPVAIIAGDVLFAKAFEIAASTVGQRYPTHAAQITKAFARACVQICEGQALDMAFAANAEVPQRAEYIAMLEKKTGALYSAAAMAGALAAGADSKEAEVLGAYGLAFGIAFQLRDDFLGILGDPKATGKPVGGDLREGKKTLPLVLALARASPSQNAVILQALGKKSASNEELEFALTVLRHLGIEGEVMQLASDYTGKALRSIEGYPDSPAKAYLEAAARFAVERQF